MDELMLDELMMDELQVSKQKKRISHGQRRRQVFNTAKHIKKLIENKDPATLTKKEKDSLTWALDVIESDIYTKPPIKPAIPKQPKADLSKGDDLRKEPGQEVAVIDLEKPTGHYTAKCGLLIEETLSRAVAEYIKEKPGATVPRFGQTRRYRGINLFHCKDHQSVKFLRNTVRYMKSWNGSKLRAILLEDLPPRPKGVLCVTDMGIETFTILGLLKAQNPQHDMTEWEIDYEEKTKNGIRSIVISLTEVTAAILIAGKINLHCGSGLATLELIKPFLFQPFKTLRRQQMKALKTESTHSDLPPTLKYEAPDPDPAIIKMEPSD